jgi:hypothetical protein
VAARKLLGILHIDRRCLSKAGHTLGTNKNPKGPVEKRPARHFQYTAGLDYKRLLARLEDYGRCNIAAQADQHR